MKWKFSSPSAPETATPTGYTLEFKLPWSNFPNIMPKAGVPIGIDIEMGSADGGHVSARSRLFRIVKDRDACDLRRNLLQ